MKKNKRAVVYVRVSTSTEEQKSSLEEQQNAQYKSILKRFEAKRETSLGTGQTPGCYVDVVTGTGKKKRPGFEKMLEDCREGKIDLIITKSVSRFARNLLLTLETIEELKSLGIGVFFVEEHINSLDTAHEFLLTILAKVAEQESKNTSSHLKQAFQERRDRGLPARPHSSCYGYSIVDGEQQPNADAEHVKEIFRMFVDENMNLSMICREAHKRGFGSPRGGRWSRTSVKRILTNTRYIGHMTETDIDGLKVVFKDQCPPIISQEMFDRAQELVKKREALGKVTDEQGLNFQAVKLQRYPLSGIVMCSHCGRQATRYARMANVENRVYPMIEKCETGIPYWKCQSHSGTGLRRATGEEICEQAEGLYEGYIYLSIVAAILEHFVVLGALGKKAFDLVEITAAHNREISNYKEAMAKYKADKKELDGKKKEYRNLFNDNLMTAEELREGLSELKKREEILYKPEHPQSIAAIENASKVFDQIFEGFESSGDFGHDMEIVLARSQERANALMEIFNKPATRHAIVRATVAGIGLGTKYKKERKNGGQQFETIDCTVELIDGHKYRFQFNRRSPDYRGGRLNHWSLSEVHYVAHYLPDGTPQDVQIPTLNQSLLASMTDEELNTFMQGQQDIRTAPMTRK